VIAQALSGARLRYIGRSLLKEVEWLPKDLQFKFHHRSDGLPPIPGPTLRHRVAGDYRIEWFHASGRETRDAFENALSTVGKSHEDFSAILDFGAGCGRVLRWIENWGQGRELHGVDIDPPAIWWCKRHIRFARVQRTSALPPLPFGGGRFDFVYSHSVFTHLDAAYQDLWLSELRRVTRPGAILLLTVSGDASWQRFFASNPEHPGMLEYRRQREENGWLFVSNDDWSGIFPDFYHSMFHTRSYVERHWSQFFVVRNYLETAMLGLQDILVLERS
jgi:SAM-dependent methyltransferase